MSKVNAGRFTAQSDKPFVVFLIGMRVNQLFAVRKVLQVASAMPKMLRVLYTHPEKGFLGGEQFFRVFPLTTILVSYWRSFEDLERFSRAKDDPHLAAWRVFNQKIGGDGTIGIWHETYMVSPGQYENVYANMPNFGLAKATKQPLPAVGTLNTARGRSGGTPMPDVQSIS